MDSPPDERPLGRCVSEKHLTSLSNNSETTSTVSFCRKGKGHVFNLTVMTSAECQDDPDTAHMPSLTITAAVSLLWFRMLNASMMAATCFCLVRVIGPGWLVGAEMLQTTVPRKSKFCSHILLGTLAFLSEHWAHLAKGLLYTQLEEMINGDHKTPGRRGNYLNCGISWPLSATHGNMSREPSSQVVRLGGFLLKGPSNN